MGDRNLRYPIGLLALAFVLSLAAIVSAQEKERPKLEDFGSSLKQIKWDADRKAASEIKTKSKSRTRSNDLDIVKVETSLVLSDVLVLDARGNPVAGLTAQDFVVTEDGTSQQVGLFVPGDNVSVPRSIVLIIDYGCSQVPFLKASVAAAKTMIEKLSPGDRIAIVTDDVELLINFTSNKKKLKEKLDELLRRTSFNIADSDFVMDRSQRGVAPFGRGFQYSALMAVLREAFDKEDQRPIVIFQTDGAEARILRNPVIPLGVEPGLPPDLRAQQEAGVKHVQKFMKRHPREFSLNDVYKAAENSRATIYTVVPGVRFIGLKPEERPEQMRTFLKRDIAGLDLAVSRKWAADYLKRAGDEALTWHADNFAKLQSALAVLSTISGGWIEFFDQPAQADGIYSRILSDMNRRYVVGYYPVNKAHDGKRRKVNIAVRNHPEYVVMGHKGYCAPPPD
jgi:VWFA-related protein